MATISSSWTENQTLHSSATVAAGVTATDDIDLAASGYVAAHVMVEIAFGSTPDDDVVVNVFGSVDSGTQDATLPIYSLTIQAATSTTKRATFTVENVPYIAVAVTNNDSADNVTYEGLYAGLKYTSA